MGGVIKIDIPVWQQIENLNEEIRTIMSKVIDPLTSKRSELKLQCEHPTLENADDYSEGGSCFGYTNYPGWVRCTVCGLSVSKDNPKFESLAREMLNNGKVIRHITSYERKNN